MKNKLIHLNYYFSEKYINAFRYTPYIQTFLFHKIYRNRSEVIPENGAILEGIDKHQFETFIKFFCKRNVQFIDETDILNDKLDPNKQYIYLTFDDGYYNNFWCLDILEKYKVKATFMISTNHIQQGKAFWWDVVFREMSRNTNNYSALYINKKILELHKIKWREQEDFIIDSYGTNALQPNNDLDRPMSASELKLFASHPYVTLGNHTHNHLNITLYKEEELIESIKLAEDFLSTVTSQKISSISYPYGYHNDTCINTISKLNYKIGITINNGKNNFSDIEDENKLLRLKRNELSGHLDIVQQCRIFHTNFSFYANIKNFKW